MTSRVASGRPACAERQAGKHTDHGVEEKVDLLPSASMNQRPARTRFAPSPTGSLHLGNARTALFNWLFARHAGGRFVLRSEDTDQARSDEGLLAGMQRDLDWLGLARDEGPDVGGDFGPYRQRERADRHAQVLTELLAADRAYYCYCTQEELAEARRRQLAAGQAPRYPGTCAHLAPADREALQASGRQPTLRFRVPDTGEVVFDDLVHGRQRFRLRDIGDFVIARADGTPAFFLANAVDDADMGITHVLRGDDHLANTPRQLLILAALELDQPAYGHFGLITDTAGQPLSKRAQVASLEDLRAAGYLPSAVRNHLARVGLSGLPQTWLESDELAAHFDIARVSRGPAAHDPAALHGWQRQAVDRLDDTAWLAWVEAVSGWPEALPRDGNTAAEFARIARPNVLLAQEAKEWAERLFGDEWTHDEAALESVCSAQDDLLPAALEMPAPHDADSFREWTRALGARTGRKGKSLFQPLRAVLTGTLSGPELPEIVSLVGADRVTRRLQQAQAIAERATSS